MKEPIRRAGAALAWLGLVLVVATGGAGIVSGADHQPGTSARAELTWSHDLDASNQLTLASTHLVELADVVAALGVQARGALAAMNGTEAATAEAAIAAGDLLVDEVLLRTSALRRELAAIAYVGTPSASLMISDEIASWHAALVSALDATDGLRAAWVRVTTGSVAAIQLGTLLARHDEQVTDAAALGRAARYEDAMAALDTAEATIGDARALATRLANTVDVTVLNEWLDRNAAYDAALRGLYAELSKVGGQVTDALRDARAAEETARRNLPPDARGLVVIMAEIGRGGMNGAVIAIEVARGKLTSAIEAAAEHATEPDGELLPPSPDATP